MTDSVAISEMWHYIDLDIADMLIIYLAVLKMLKLFNITLSDFFQSQGCWNKFHCLLELVKFLHDLYN